MAARTPTMVEIIENAMKRQLAEARVCMPAEVVSYDAAEQSCSVQPQLRDAYIDGDGTRVSEPLPRIDNVPVMFPGAGGFRLTFPIKAGDTVLLVFTDRSLDAWLTAGGLVDPSDVRAHHLSDAIAIPGLHSFNKAWTGASTDSATFGSDGGPQIEMKEDVIRLGLSSSDPGSSVARDGDPVSASTDMSSWISAVNGVTGVLAVPTQVGTINGGNSKVKA